jgi:two-component system response regulator DevR
VLLIDDHEVVREGLRTVLQGKSGHIQVVGEGGSVAEAVRVAERLQPDVVVMDVRLPDGSGVEACREIRSRRAETAVLMLTSFSDDEALMQSIMAGAAGYLLKHVRGAELVSAIEAVHRGEAKTNREIGQAVFLSEKTVKHYVSSILTKLEVAHRSEAAAKWARHQGGTGGTAKP